MCAQHLKEVIILCTYKRNSCSFIVIKCTDRRYYLQGWDCRPVWGWNGCCCRRVGSWCHTAGRSCESWREWRYTAERRPRPGRSRSAAELKSWWPDTWEAHTLQRTCKGSQQHIKTLISFLQDVKIKKKCLNEQAQLKEHSVVLAKKCQWKEKHLHWLSFFLPKQT